MNNEMFNFNLQNRAFNELNAEQFRMIYFLNNTLSMVNEKHNTPDNNKFEMFNGYMMDKLGLCERQVQRLIKGLEELGYISVERAKKKKSPNIITINSDINDDIHCDINCDINCDKNVTLNKNIKIKEIYTSTSTGLEMSCNEKEKIKNKKENFEGMKQVDDCTSSNKEQVKNELILNEKENEMNDNGMNGMNVKGNGVKRNETTTSLATANDDVLGTPTTEIFIKSNNDFNGSIFKENCPTPITPQSPPSFPKWNEDEIFGSGCVETRSMGKLSTNGHRTQPDARECPQIEFDEQWFTDTYRLIHNFNTSEEFEALQERLKQKCNRRLLADLRLSVTNRNMDEGLALKAYDLIRTINYKM